MPEFETLDSHIEQVQENVGAEVRAVAELTTGARGPSFDPVLPVDDAEMARFIDHTLLKAQSTRADVERVCAEAVEYKFASVCVNSTWTATVNGLLEGSPVSTCTVAGFPLGAMSDLSKAGEARMAVADGAAEIDMVIAIGRLLGGEYGAVLDDIAAVVEASAPATVKVILETCYLDDADKIAGCLLSMAAGAGFVKTSTGFGTGGATAADVALMRRVVGDALGVKASGGVHSKDDLLAMVTAGANRIGASSSVELMTGTATGGESGGY